LDDQGLFALPDTVLRLKEPVEYTALVVDRRFGRVDVLWLIGLGGQHPPSEANDLPNMRENGKHHAPAKPVRWAGVVRPTVGQAGILQNVRGHVMLGCRPDQRVPRIESESEHELRDHMMGEATPSEIVQRGSTLRSPREDVMIESGRKSQGMK